MLEKINEALKRETNVYLKFGFVILECTGMRLGDLLLLGINCIAERPISGYTISWYDHKNRKRRDNLPVPTECKVAVDQLLEATADIRREATGDERQHLFIKKPAIGTHKKPVITIKRQTFALWCRTFCENHDIRDGSGEVFRITSHMFRRTLATDMLSKGTNLKVIQDVLGHAAHASTRRYYADVKSRERAEMFSQIGILGNIHQVGKQEIHNQIELEWFSSNFAGKARLSDGYCTLPLQGDKPCDRFMSRQKCYLCSRFITTLDDLDAHKSHLAELQEMLEANIYGEHFAAHITPTIAALKEIIKRLEVLKDGR
jgi:hypothetical protein